MPKRLMCILMFSGAILHINCISVELCRGVRFFWSNLGRVAEKSSSVLRFSGALLNDVLILSPRSCTLLTRECVISGLSEIAAP